MSDPGPLDGLGQEVAGVLCALGDTNAVGDDLAAPDVQDDVEVEVDAADLAR